MTRLQDQAVSICTYLFLKQKEHRTYLENTSLREGEKEYITNISESF